MATKTLIRSKRQHEVRLEEGSQVARSQQQHAGDDAPHEVPVSIRKSAPASRRASRASSATGAQAHAEVTAAVRPAPKKTKAPSAARKTPAASPPVAAAKPAPAKPASAKSAATASKPAVKKVTAAPAPRPSPRLPAHVPADGLWEADSAVMQRLQSLIERNAQLAEQLQRLQSKTPLKGSTP